MKALSTLLVLFFSFGNLSFGQSFTGTYTTPLLSGKVVLVIEPYLDKYILNFHASEQKSQVYIGEPEGENLKFDMILNNGEVLPVSFTWNRHEISLYFEYGRDRFNRQFIKVSSIPLKDLEGFFENDSRP